MNYQELQRESRQFSGALLVEALVSSKRLRFFVKLSRVIFLAALVACGAASALAGIPSLGALLPQAAEVSVKWLPALQSAALLAAALWLAFEMCEAFYFSYYFRDVDETLPEPGLSKKPAIRFELADIAAQGARDPLVDFFASRFGLLTALRLGLSGKEIAGFLTSRARVAAAAQFELASAAAPLTLAAFAASLLAAFPDLHAFLAARELENEDFVGAAGWVSEVEMGYKKSRRWWGRDELGRIPGIGKDWAYGETALLTRYAVPITSHRIFSEPEGAIGEREETEIERVLSREREANVLLVGEEGLPKLLPLVRLERKIRSGVVLPPLEHKRIFVFDGAPFASAMKEKTLFEQELIRLLAEAAKAGNIIFCFDNFDRFFTAARSLGSDLLSLLDPFLVSPQLQVAAISETGAYHALFEMNPLIKERFERVLFAETGAAALMPALEDNALRIEAREGIFFTYPALRAAAVSASRYFEGALADKAVDLLLELAPSVKTAGRRLISREDVFALVSRKTGIAVGETKEPERAKLLNLERILHERIVGQDEAISALSGALRRARSGVGNPNRPMGSFLFLGPTGVGKTETTKALAAAFFGGEKSITRLDMSEYQSADALRRLIGVFESGQPGELASLLREKPYGVLLLDEFEKTDRSVHDLFLQILDEGFFTDAFGQKVNARNLMIIATSNAGSDRIWELVKAGKGLDRDAVITEIINRGIFKPELLNRFDGVILFKPLGADELRAVARFQLQKLSKRLLEKGLELVITEPLLDYLVSVGQDPKFGARPMNRAIAEHIEQTIAEKLLRREISAGSRVELSEAELRGGTSPSGEVSSRQPADS